MDSDIYLFVENKLPEALRPVVYSCFEMFHEMDLNEYESPYIELILQEQFMTPEDLQDTFMQQLHTHLNIVLNHFHIQMRDGTPAALKATCVGGLHQLVNMTNYDEVYSVLQTTDPADLKLAKILADICGVNELRILDALEWFDGITLKRLSDFILKRQGYVAPEQYPVGYDAAYALHQLKLFNQVFPTEKVIDEEGEEEERDFIGVQLAKTTVMGERFSIYYNYVSDAFQNLSPEMLAKQFLSMCYICVDTYKDPLQAWRDNNHEFTSDYNVISQVEKFILQATAKMQNLGNQKHA